MTFISSKVAVASILLAFASTPALSATVTGGSNILTDPFASTLEAWLVNDASIAYDGSLAFDALFAKTVGDTALDFHAAVDGAGPTIFVAQATDNRTGQTHVIGGYNPQSWNSLGNYHVTEALESRTAFIFNLTSGVRQDQSASDWAASQTFNHPLYGPTFGRGNDIAVSADLNSGHSYAYSFCSDRDASCHGSWGDLDIFGQAYVPGASFSVGALDVFSINVSIQNQRIARLASVPTVPLPGGFGFLLGAMFIFARIRMRK